MNSLSWDGNVTGAAAVEARIESLSAAILSRSAEFWEERNRAVLDLTALILQVKQESPSRVTELLRYDVIRCLLQPVKEMILDLRSQQVRDTCTFLTVLGEILGDDLSMRSFLREIFDTVLQALKAPNKVMSGYVDECILSLIRNCPFKSGLASILTEIKDSKSKHMRERCLDYICEVMTSWELTDREMDLVADSITTGLEDASAKAREIARNAYLLLRVKNMKRAERLKAAVSPSLRMKLIRVESEYDAAEQRRQKQAAVSASAELDTAAAAASSSSTAEDKGSEEAMNDSQSTAQGASESNNSSGMKLLDTNGILTHRNMIPLGDGGEVVPQGVISGLVSLQAAVRGSISRRSLCVAAPASRPRVDVPLLREDSPPDTVNESNLHVIPESPGAHGSKYTSPVSPSQGSTVAESMIEPSFPETPEAVFELGARVSISLEGVPSYGTVHFFGETEFAAGKWVGIVLDHPKGKNDGCVQDVRYFICTMNHGLFAKAAQVSPLPADQDPLEMKYSTKELLGSLKVKIAKTMDALNRELEIAEEMESLTEMKSREYASLVARLCEYCAEEWNTLSDFKADVDRLCTF